MIDGLDNLLEESGQPGLMELRQLLLEILGGTDTRGQVLDQHRLPARRPRVYRLRFVIDGWIRSVIAKRMEPAAAERNQLVINRWLPAIGLGDNGPILLGVAAGRNGQSVWHVYDDLGERALDTSDPEGEHVRAAVALMAQLHMRFTRHSLLAECRLHGGDLGVDFYSANVRDAIGCLESLQTPAVVLSAERSALRERLLSRLRQLQNQQAVRAQVMAEFGGAETLLHGDLWTGNIFVLPAVHGVQARLIDWDHTGVGPISYDLSTFLLRFPIHERLTVWNLYRQAVRPAGWNPPSVRGLNLLFETAEFSRLANCIIWPAIALAHDRIGWGFEELAHVDQWFENWKPVLPEDS